MKVFQKYSKLKETTNLVFNILCVFINHTSPEKRVEKIGVKMAFHLVACAQLHQRES